MTDAALATVDAPTAAGPATPAAAPDPLPAERYDLGAEIARGGMGEVFAAYDRHLGREVAVKVLQGQLVGTLAAGRFRDEARITGQLQHPGVPPVYDLGALADGRPFLAMKLIKGDTLDALVLRDGPGGRWLSAFEGVCQAVAYAHAHGVVHRDLKPQNVMVGAFGDVQVMDWGLAKVLGAGAADPRRLAGPDDPLGSAPGTRVHSGRAGDDATRFGSVLGTPAYMAPEQAIGATDLLDRRTDVFGLGAVLCHLLTGRPPYLGDTSEGTRQLAAWGNQDGAHARLAGCGADPGVVALCRRCLAPDPADRPADAGAVAAAVASLRAAADDRARRAEVEAGRAEVRAAEERKRRRAHLALAAAVLALVGVGGGTGWWVQSARAAATAEQAARRAATDSGMLAALADARERTAEAWTLAARPDRMRTAAHLAVTAVGRAEGVADAGDPSPATRADLEAARSDAADLDRHARLLAAGDEAVQANTRSPEATARLRRALADGFRAFGWDVATDPAERLAERLVASRVRDSLLGLVCEWAGYTYGGDGAKLNEVVRLIRTRAGGLLRRWQELADRRDGPGLVALASDPGMVAIPPDLLKVFGQNLRDFGEPAAALDFLRRATDRHPGHVWLRDELCLSYSETRPPRWAEALWHEAAASALRPDSAWIQNNLGVCLNKLGVRAEAVAAIRRAAGLDPTSEVASRNLARATGKPDGPAEQLARLREAARLDRENPVAHYRLGVALRAGGDLAGAAASLREAVRLDGPNHRGQAINDLADVLHDRGDTAEQLAVRREIVRLAPKDWVANNHLAWLLATGPDGVRDGREAVTAATRTCELTGGKEPVWLDTLAAAHAAAGDFDQAVRKLEELLAWPGLPREREPELQARLDLYRRRQPYRHPAFAPLREVAPPPRPVQ